MYEFYRQSIIGKALQDTLEEKIYCNQLTPAQAELILKHFDDAIPIVFSRSVTNTINFKGNVNTYNHVDGVWKFSIKNFTMTINNEVVRSEFVKVVVCANDIASGTERRRRGRG